MPGHPIPFQILRLGDLVQCHEFRHDITVDDGPFQARDIGDGKPFVRFHIVLRDAIAKVVGGAKIVLRAHVALLRRLEIPAQGLRVILRHVVADDEAQDLLDELLDFACQPPRTYTHTWSPGDLFMWDNRCCLHAAQPYDYNEARVLRHTRVAGDPASELVVTGRDDRAAGFEPTASNR